MNRRNIWFTCCTHYNHEKILNFKNWNGEPERPEFSNVDEMNQCLMEHWNEVVKPDDLVYHLGDVFFGSKEKFQNDFKKFHGNKRLILGNHDDVKFLSNCGLFNRVYADLPLPDYRFFVSHRPAHKSQMYDYGSQNKLVNIHGHIHRNPSPSSHHINVCVEQNNYYPFHVDELIEKAKELNLE